MAKAVTLPSGATVTLKDPSLLLVKDRKRVLLSAEGEGGDLSRALALGDAIIAMLVTEWSFDLVIPSVRIDSLGELTMADYDALVEHTKDAQNALFPSLTSSKENEADPKAITEDSKG